MSGADERFRMVPRDRAASAVPGGSTGVWPALGKGGRHSAAEGEQG